MQNDFKNKLTPEMCLEWFQLKGNKKVNYESSNLGRYAFECQHFGIRSDNCSESDLERIKLSLLREKKLNFLNI
jgi:hypothetical protein